MVEIVNRVIGAGITRRTTKRVVLREPDEIAAGLDSFFSRHNAALTRPWGKNADLIKSVQAAADEVRAASPNPAADGNKAWNDYWRPRESSAWYLNTMSKYAAAAERSVAEGRPWEAIDFALEIGELLTELRMKKLWERPAMVGEALLRNSGRKGAQADRVRAVDELVASGVGTVAAFSLVAEREGSGVKPGTIGKDYYAARKSVLPGR